MEVTASSSVLAVEVRRIDETEDSAPHKIRVAMDDLLVLRSMLASECVQCLEQGMSARLCRHPAHPACVECHGGQRWTCSFPKQAMHLWSTCSDLAGILSCASRLQWMIAQNTAEGERQSKPKKRGRRKPQFLEANHLVRTDLVHYGYSESCSGPFRLAYSVGYIRPVLHLLVLADTASLTTAPSQFLSRTHVKQRQL